MAAQISYLYKCCPACGGRARAEAKLPLAHANKPETFNLDDLAHIVETQTIGFLLALVELLPYKIFICQKCGHEFQMQSRAAKELVHSMLVAMQPVAAATSPMQRTRKRTVLPLPRPESLPGAEAIPAPIPAVVSRPAPAGPARRKPQVTDKPAPEKLPPDKMPPDKMPPDWEPYHLDSDMDAIFDQFKEE
jgi:hypothetical protein